MELLTLEKSSCSRLAESPVTFLGPEIEHRDSLAEMLEGRTGGLSWLPDSLSFLKRDVKSSRSRLVRLVDQIRGTSDSSYLTYVTKALNESASRVILAYWGTIPLPDLLAIKKARSGQKLVLMVLCYPLALTRVGISRQNFFMRRAARYLDGFLFPSEEMRSYFLDNVLDRHAPPTVVIPPCWPATFQATTRSLPAENAPNLIYAGRTDLAGKTVHPADDIRDLMRSILQSGIELHHVYSPETDDGHPRRTLFQPLSLSGLIELMSSFDASLIAYNTVACARDDRFRLTVPDRLVTSVAAGVPIAVPRQGYHAVKSYLRDYPPVIEFDSAGGLAETLDDRQLVSRLRDSAWVTRQNYVARRHGATLQEFLEQLL